MKPIKSQKLASPKKTTKQPLKKIRQLGSMLWQLRMRIPARYVIHVVVLVFAGLVAFRNATSTTLQDAFKSSDRIGRFINIGQQDLIVEGIETLPTTEINDDGETILSAGLELPALAVNTGELETLALLSRQDKVAITAQDALLKPSIAQTKKGSRPRREIIYYTVQPGDTLSTIAEKFDLNLRTILWNNDYNSESLIKDGDEIIVMPFDGIRHEVAAGETFDEIVSKYQASFDKTLAINNLLNENAIKEGQYLLIPDGIKPAPPKPVEPTEPTQVAVASTSYSDDVYGDISQATGDTASTGTMVWPSACSTITQYFAFGHTGVDIACAYGSTIVAADGGTVQSVGWDSGYGLAIVIRHDNGLYTRYAHLQSGGALVVPGQAVSQGQTIGLEGSTGWSTGPHLHFEVMTSGGYGGFLNPLNYI